MKRGLMEILLMILSHLADVVSPEIREMIRATLANLYQHAEKTSNPFDNIAILILATLVGFSKEDLER